MALSLASCLTALNSSGSVLLGCGFAWLRAPTTPTWALGCSCSNNGGLDTSRDLTLGKELRTVRKVQTSEQGLQLKSADFL